MGAKATASRPVRLEPSAAVSGFCILMIMACLSGVAGYQIWGDSPLKTIVAAILFLITAVFAVFAGGCAYDLVHD